MQSKFLTHLAARDLLAPKAEELAAVFARRATAVVGEDQSFADADAKEINDLGNALAELAPVMLRIRRAGQAKMRDELLQQFIGAAVVPDTVDIEEARQRAQTIRSLFEGTPWVMAPELASLTGVTLQGVLDWKKKRRIFAVKFEGKDRYPLYAIGHSNRPIPELAAVIRTLGEYSDMRKAVWFDSPSSFLGGQRPREVLGADAVRVVRAAEDAIASEHAA